MKNIWNLKQCSQKQLKIYNVYPNWKKMFAFYEVSTNLQSNHKFGKQSLRFKRCSNTFLKNLLILRYI